MSEFVHLHCHTEYSLLDGAIRLKDLCARACEYGMPAAAITDHGNMFGAVNFYLAAKKAGIKPILGCEVYVAATNREDRESVHARTRYHLVLLAQNLLGYHNLVRLVTLGHLEGFHYKPRVDKELLAKHGDGLIALSGCLRGEVVQKLIHEGFDAGAKAAREYEALFPGRFYLEVQANGLEEQERANDMLIELSKAMGLPLAATNDCHYLSKDDAEAHDILLCIQTNARVDDEKRMRFSTKELYYRSPEEMRSAFSHCPDAVSNTVRIAEQCNVELPLGELFFPAYHAPNGKSLEEELRDLSKKGLTRRLSGLPYTVDEKEYWDRLEYELDVIVKMGFAGYFLIVQDFINWAKDKGIPVGPGRGSAAGSLVSYALRITNLDPLPYNLLFERFLNIARVSMPDIDVDFCERRRGEVIRYVTEKYGSDCVAQITTFGTMKARAVVRDVGRVLGLSFAETDRIAKLIPEALKITIDKAIEAEPELRDMVKNDERTARLVDISRRLEGLHRHASTHAAGVVLSDRPMVEYLPLYKGKKDEVVTQYDMKMVEKTGLIKFDFLGLRTMTVIQDTLHIIAERGKEPPDMDVLPLDDAETYALYSRGDTDGVFQVESSGMRRYLRMLKPTCFDDLIAMLALYRPGPLGSGRGHGDNMVDEFIKRKHGEVKVTYPVPALEEVLKPTYGVIVYQEQVMKIAQVVSGYSLGHADLLRRAMGKKIAKAMAEQRFHFVKGAEENKIPKAKANEIFDTMETFAEYGFNKSHSAAYALISYYTAFLKANYPTEFMAAVITSEVGNQDKVLKYIGACRDMDITVLPPDVNTSMDHFTVRQDRKIVFGLSGIKNVGHEAIREIVEERSENGPYKSLLDLCERVGLRKVTKRVLEYLIKSGSLDSLGCTRAGLMEGLDRAVAVAQKKAREKASGQMSLLAVAGMEVPVYPGVGFPKDGPDAEEWPDQEKLRYEKEALGFFLSSHPLLTYRQEIKRLGIPSLAECAELPEKTEVRTAVMVTDVKEHITKKGDKMAFCGIEDLSGSGEVTMFPEIYQRAKPLIAEDRPLLLSARVSEYNGTYGNDQENGPKRVRLLAGSVSLLIEAFEQSSDPVVLVVDADKLAGSGLGEFKELLSRYPGQAPVKLCLKLPDAQTRLQLGPNYQVRPCADFWREAEEWTGRT